MADLLYLRVIPSAGLHQASSSSSSSRPLKLLNSNINSSSRMPTSTRRPSPANKVQKLNLEVSPHRAVSAVRLMRIEQGGAFADLLNEKGKGSGDNEMGYVQRTLGFRPSDLDARDLRLVTDIVGGTIRWRRYLDHLICSIFHDERMFQKMEPLLVQILRIGFYEIVKLDMPSYAVVDENVRLAKLALRPGAGNLVNGILRKLILLKEKNLLPLPKVEGDDRTQARALATHYSHPVWMVRRWTKYLGQDGAIRLMTWNNTEPSFSLRANRGKGVSRYDIAGKLHELKDESAGLVVSVVDPHPGEEIIDCCAAPGGKTLYMASLMRSTGRIYAIDINKGRLRILKEAAKLQNVDGIVTTVNSDIRNLAGNKELKCGKVLLDAPCSGLGVLSKRADLRWNRRLEDLEQLKNLQDELLNAASTLVKAGGVLVYSTCSIDPEENEERVEAFLSRHPEFSVDSAGRYVPSQFVTQHGYYRSDPVKHSLDGAFAARLIRES